MSFEPMLFFRVFLNLQSVADTRFQRKLNRITANIRRTVIPLVVEENSSVF